jgi:hypothetical protein
MYLVQERNLPLRKVREQPEQVTNAHLVVKREVRLGVLSQEI